MKRKYLLNSIRSPNYLISFVYSTFYFKIEKNKCNFVGNRKLTVAHVCQPTFNSLN